MNPNAASRAPRGSICISQASGRGLAGRRLMMKSLSAPRPDKDARAGIADILLQTQNDEYHVHPYLGTNVIGSLSCLLQVSLR